MSLLKKFRNLIGIEGSEYGTINSEARQENIDKLNVLAHEIARQTGREASAADALDLALSTFFEEYFPGIISGKRKIKVEKRK